MKVLLTAILCVLPFAANAATYVFDTTDNGKTRKSTAIATDNRVLQPGFGFFIFQLHFKHLGGRRVRIIKSINDGGEG